MIPKEFIRNELRYRFPNMGGSIHAPQTLVGRPLLFEVGGRSPGQRIVICTKEELDVHLGAAQNEPLFLCIGMPRAEILAENDVCILPDGEQAGVVLNFVQRLFDRLDDWTQRLRIAAETGEDVETLLLRASDMLQNPVFLLDERGHILAQSDESARIFDTTILQARDQANGENTCGGIRHIANKTDPDMLVIDLTSGSIRFTLVCIASERPLYATDEIVLDSLAGFLRLTLSEHTLGLGARRLRRENEAVERLRALLQAVTPERQAIEALDRLGWKEDEAYAILAIEPKNGDLRARQADAICERVEAALEGSCAFVMTPYLCAVVPTTLANDTSFRSCLHTLTGENPLMIGVSDAFSGFSLFPQRLEQAKRALDYAASREGIAISSDLFEDELIQSKQAELPSELLCLRSVLALAQYDKEHGTDYLVTASSYVEHRFNAVQTAGALFIHRSTFLYRLQRIKEQFGLDLDDRNLSLLHVLYSLKIAKTLKFGTS